MNKLLMSKVEKELKSIKHYVLKYVFGDIYSALYIAGLGLLFFLPIVESLSRSTGFVFLFLSAILIGLAYIKRTKVTFDLLDLLLVVLLTLMTISTLFSWSPGRSFQELLRYFSYFVIFKSIRAVSVDKIINYFFIPSILVNSTLLSFLSLVYLVPQLGLQGPQNGMNLFFLSFGHNHVTDILIFAIPTTLSLFKIALSFKRKIYGFLLVLFTAAFILSFGRGALLSLVLAYLIYNILLGKKSRDWKIWLFFLLVIFILVSLSHLLYISGFFYPDKTKILKPLFSDWRVNYINQAVKGIFLSPFWGVGLDSFRYLSKLYQQTPKSWSWYVHNHYLQLFAEAGVFTGFLFILITSFIIYQAYKKVKIDTSEEKIKSAYLGRALFVSLLATSINSLFDYNWQYLSIFFYFWLSAAIFYPVPSQKLIKNSASIYFLFLVIFIISFGLYMLLPLDADEALEKTVKYEMENQTEKAVSVLLKAQLFEPRHDGLLQKLADSYSKNYNTWDKSHILYKKAFLTNPLDLQNAVKADYLLYLRQAYYELGKKNVGSSLNYLKKAHRLYYLYAEDSLKSYLEGDSSDSSKKNQNYIENLGNAIKFEEKMLRKKHLEVADVEKIQKIVEKELSSNR